MKHIICCVIFFSCIALSAEQETIEIPDSRKEFTIAIGSFSSTRNSITGEYIAEKLRESLKRDIGHISFHRYSEEDLERYKENLCSEKIRLLTKQLSQVYEQRDTAYLKQDDSSLEKKTEEIAILLEQRAAIERRENLEFNIEAEKPLVIKEEIQEIAAMPEKSYLDENSIDLFIQIDVTSSGEVFGVTIRSLDFFGTETMIAKEVGTADELFEDLGDDLFTLQNLIRGYTAFNVTIRTEPEDATIFIDDVLAGSGYYSSFVEPGEYRITVKRPGFASKEEDLSIGENQAVDLNVTLEAYESYRFSIQTVPANAHVYMDSKPVGVSPLFTTSYDDFHVFQFDMEGYQEQKMIFEPGDSKDIRIVLKPDYADINDLFEIRKWNFYRSFGSFILSIPVTLFLSSLTAEYGKYGELNEPFADQYTLSTICLYGSISINIVLFAQTIVSLYEYIDVGKQTIRGEFVDTGR